jgi:hypothetical protein
MNYKYGITVTLMAGVLSLSIPMQSWGSSDPMNLDISVLHGVVQARQGSTGAWTSAGDSVSSSGTWLRTDGSTEAVVTLPNQIRVRLEGSTCFRVQSQAFGAIKLQVASGKAFTSIPASVKDSLTVEGRSSTTVASNGDFLLDLTGSVDRIQVVDGDARLTVKAAAAENKTQSSAVEKKANTSSADVIALDGPDVRSRKKDADEFNRKRKKKKSKAAAVTNVPATTPPATTPPVDVPPVETPPTVVTPPPADVAPVVTTTAPAAVGGGGGGTPFFIAGGVALFGGALALALTGHGNSTSPQIPVSP